MDPIEFHDFLIEPTLDRIGMDQPGAAQLLIGTALVESGLKRLRQVGGGPALSFFQVEPDTHDDIWENWLAFRPNTRRVIERLMVPNVPGIQQLLENLPYAVAMARLVYRRVRYPLPKTGDVPAMALYWKTHFNTFQAEQSHKYVTVQLERFIARFPKELLER